MRVIKQEVLEKMSIERLKIHRRTVLAHISSHFYEYGTDKQRTPINHDTENYKYCISYRNQVNHYYDKKKVQ